MFSSIVKYEVGSHDHRYVRNIKIFRQYFIEELARRKENPKDGNDLMTMLMKDPVYEGKDA